MTHRKRDRLLEGVHWRRHADGQTASPWLASITEGLDDGYFGRGSAVWHVHGALPTLIGGIRALLIQALHPGPLTGVQQHSRYREDTAGRLERTTRWVATTTFGDCATAEASALHVRRLHVPVQGDFVDALGRTAGYSANDPELGRWVHNAFTLGFLGAHETWGHPIPGGSDRYVGEWARAGTLMGIADPPRTRAELEHQLHASAPELVSDERVTDLVRFLRRPPLPLGMRLVYPVLFAGAVASLPADLRNRTGLRRPRWPAITACRLLLAVFGVVLGRRSPSARAAEARTERLRVRRRGSCAGP